MSESKVAHNENKVEEAEDKDKIFPWNRADCFKRMRECNDAIKMGATAFLKKEYLILTFFCIVFAAVLLCAVDQPWRKDLNPVVPYTTICFLVGAFTSMLAGYVGMMVATTTNVVTTYECCTSVDDGFKVAYQGGQVLGFCLVGFAVLVLEILILSFKGSVMNHAAVNGHASQEAIQEQTLILFEMISGYGLGGSTVALFGRVGGGIYTKAADVGADLAGKVIENLPEDSPLNPGTIADNVGDNVGDIAGMGADLFGSLAESTCAALVCSATSWPLVSSSQGAIYFPLLVTSVGIAASFITVLLANVFKDVQWKLRMQLIISTVLMSVCVVPLLFMLPE